ncbi:hypothetical protein ACQKJ1_25640, partial [Methylorubrum rhodesianum]|uniref:hypothetical protein n=1 Tax=Methylorubrum rhodesianum TaxID=29427 RepID=UPI003D08B7B9
MLRSIKPPEPKVSESPDWTPILSPYGMPIESDLAPWSALVLKLGSVDEETDDEEEPVQRRAD